jgi:hypothetical protein
VQALGIRQQAVAKPPAMQPVRLGSQRRWRHRYDRAARVPEAVPGDLGRRQAAHRAASACANDQDITRLGCHIAQDGAGLAAHDLRRNLEVGWGTADPEVDCSPEPLPGRLNPGPAQLRAWSPAIG